MRSQLFVISVFISVFPADVPTELNHTLDQGDQESPHIKDQREQLQGLARADISKSEDDEEKPQSLQHHQSQTDESREAEPPASNPAQQMETTADEEDCGGPEAARNTDPHGHLLSSAIKRKKSWDCSVCEKRLKNESLLRRHMRVHTGEKPFGCNICGKRFSQKDNTADNFHNTAISQDTHQGP